MNTPSSTCALDRRDRPPSFDEANLRFAAGLLRHRMLGKDAFPDFELVGTEWYVFLELYIAAGSGRHLCLSDLYHVAHVPKTTAIRVIAGLVCRQHLERENDPHDARRKMVWLAPGTLARLDALLHSMREISESPSWVSPAGARPPLQNTDRPGADPSGQEAERTAFGMSLVGNRH
jgi:DNA-binding MarR family transcriptional regulator